MQLNAIDWAVIGAYFLLSLLVGLYYSKRAGKNVESYFLSDRSVPWWLLGVSMVATTFAADTPLAVTGMVASHGVAGNWLWWSFAFSGMLTVFFYARLWRRAEVMTDVEFTEIRYAGRSAAILRGFRALYLALPINCIIMGWVTLGMAKVLGVSFGLDKWQAIVLCLIITVSYSILSGLWGVLVTDFVQFIIAMFGTTCLAYFAVKSVGGIEALKTRVEAIPEVGSPLSVIPDVNSAWMPLVTFFVYLAVNWWAAWYPGAEPGGGGYIAQRMFSAKNERHAFGATFFFNFAHYALRPWPWILVALVAMITHPELKGGDKELGYVKVMVDVLPHTFRGLLLAAFAAAYMSTISTQLNWGASYLVNDFYRRFLVPQGSDHHYVLVGRVATFLLMVAAGIVTYFMSSIEGAWKFLIGLGAGTGAVYLLRWYWWRINAWSEISAMIASFVVSIYLQTAGGYDSDNPRDFAYLMLITVSFSTVTWLIVTFLTRPEPEERLIAFFRRVRPNARFWRPIAARAPEVKADADGMLNLLDWALGCVFIFLSLFGIGKLVLLDFGIGLLYLAGAAVAVSIIFFDLRRRNEH